MHISKYSNSSENPPDPVRSVLWFHLRQRSGDLYSSKIHAADKCGGDLTGHGYPINC